MKECLAAGLIGGGKKLWNEFATIIIRKTATTTIGKHNMEFGLLHYQVHGKDIKHFYLSLILMN